MSNKDKYLVNPFCEIEPMFDFDPDIKYNIISVCFFKMNRPYKKFHIYLNGIQRMLNYRKKFLPDFKFRIFADDTILDDADIMKKLREDPDVQIVRYKCPNFMEPDNYHHSGIFGMFVRFFPMFDFDNNDANYVIVADIEPNDEDMNMMENIYSFVIKEKINYPFIYFGNLFYSPYKNQEYPFVVGGRLHNLSRLPKDSIINFINNIDNIPYVNKDYLQKQNPNDRIKYGIDETYLNKYLLNDLIKNNITVGCYSIYGVSYPFYYAKKSILNHNKSDVYLKFILGKYYDSKKDIEYHLNFIDKTFYMIKQNTPTTSYITKRFIKLLKYLKKEEIYDWMPKRFIDIILNFYTDVIYETGIITINQDNSTKYVNSKISINNNLIGGDHQHKYNKYKIKFLGKKYRIPYKNIKPNHLRYYYTAEPQLCCRYILEPISNDIKSYDFKGAIEYLNNYYKHIKSDYYRNLFEVINKNESNDIYSFQVEIADRIMFEYLKFRKNTCCITLWPIAVSAIDVLLDFLRKYGNIYYVKRHSISFNAASNLVYQLYSDTTRFKDIVKINEKARYTGWEPGSVSTVIAIFFENTSNEVITGDRAPLKMKIRKHLLDALNVGDDSNIRGDDIIHINDYFYQTLEYAKIYLHAGSINFLSKQNLNGYLDKSTDRCRLFINTYKKWMIENIRLVDYDRFLLFGSSILYAYGIRNCGDVDGLVSMTEPDATTNNLMEKIASYFYDESTKFFFADLGLVGTKYWKSEWNAKDVNWFILSNIKHQDELIFNPQNHFYFNGIKLLTLEKEIFRKYARGKSKDIGDIIIIEKILNVSFDKNYDNLKFEKQHESTKIDIKKYLTKFYHISGEEADQLIDKYFRNN
jgi:hypothetical protein